MKTSVATCRWKPLFAKWSTKRFLLGFFFSNERLQSKHETMPLFCSKKEKEEGKKRKRKLSLENQTVAMTPLSSGFLIKKIF